MYVAELTKLEDTFAEASKPQTGAFAIQRQNILQRGYQLGHAAK